MEVFVFFVSLCLFLFFRNLLDRDTFSKSDPSKLVSYHSLYDTHVHTNRSVQQLPVDLTQIHRRIYRHIYTHSLMHVYRWILNSTGKQTQPQTNIHHMRADLVLCKHSLHALHMDTHTLPRLCESVDICICQGSYSSLFSAPSVSEGNQIIFTHKPAASLLQIKRNTYTLLTHLIAGVQFGNWSSGF